uniref:Uncharacterized protein n=1 Tax=Chrysotila carterae TaxID=13221 RepID=A0A7S4BLC0_CHRCT
MRLAESETPWRPRGNRQGWGRGIRPVRDALADAIEDCEFRRGRERGRVQVLRSAARFSRRAAAALVTSARPMAPSRARRTALDRELSCLMLFSRALSCASDILSLPRSQLFLVPSPSFRCSDPPPTQKASLSLHHHRPDKPFSLSLSLSPLIFRPSAYRSS